MRQLQLIILILIALISNVKSQNKTILGDTSFCYQCDKTTIDKLNLKDYLTSQDEFNFRFRNYGQIVEISKTNDLITGVLTNYIFKLKSKNYKRTDTLFNKVELTKSEISIAIEIINSSKIMDLEPMDKIKDWALVQDGTTYIIEQADSKNYYYKSYWSPGAQDSIPESLIVMNFIRKLSDTLKLTDRYNEFKTTIPKNGCYNSGGISTMCFISNSYGLGLISSARLPFGYQFSIYQEYLGKSKLSMVFFVSHQLDFKGQHDLYAYIGKGHILLRKYENFADFVGYSYRYRKLLSNDRMQGNSNNKIYYGFTIKQKFNIGGGADYLKTDINEIGGLIYVSQWFPKPKISLGGASSIFNSHTDFKFGISKSFYFYRKLQISNVNIGLDYEKFYGFEDMRLSLMIRL